uniref:small monomeric GTPase n=1 Tax=Trichuris muris TaxID=70415 RepID=A0A5S6QDS4_TRIMR
MLRNRKALNEIHIAVVGADGSGKSALTVKFMTKRYIGEYDGSLEDTYCKQITVNNNECMLWIMDTVERDGKSSSRYISWADVFLLLYSVTDKVSFEYAESLLKDIHGHDHSVCVRSHTVCLIGNKCDLERYRQVSKNQGAIMAAMYSAKFYEISVTEEYSTIKNLFRDLTEETLISRERSSTMATQMSQKNRLWMNDAVRGDVLPSDGSILKTIVDRRSKSPSVKVYDSIKVKMPPTVHQKKSSGLKILKLFQEKYKENS